MDFTYNGKSFNQRPDDNYVNLGQLCATHDKQLNDWTRTKSSNAYLEALSASTGIPVLELMISKIGNEGTWGHPLVALEVARWISPQFGVWCNNHIKTLMEEGVTTLAPKSTGEMFALAAQEFLKIEKELALARQERELARLEQKRAKQEREELFERVRANTTGIEGIKDSLAGLQEFVSQPVEGIDQSQRQLITKAFQELGSVLVKTGAADNPAHAYREPWRQLGLEMRNSDLHYDLNARYANSKRKYEEDLDEWRNTGRPRGKRPQKVNHLDLLERDSMLPAAFRYAKKVVQDSLNYLFNTADD